MKKSSKKSSLSSRALLVSVNISQWTARRLDRVATETVIKNHSADRSAGSYTKKLLPGAKELEVVSTLVSQIRKYFYEQTLPWMSDGARIISSKNLLKFSSEMRKMRSNLESAISDFVAAYPRLQQEAKAKLGNLYNSEEYPDASDIASKFRCEVSYLPMPDQKDFRVEISEVEKKEFLDKMREVESRAMRDCWERLYNVVKKASEKLSQPDAIFRDSLIENISDICSLLPSLNVSDDETLENSRIEIEKLISSLSPETLRVNRNERDSAAKKLKDITDKMDSIMIGLK